MYNLIGAYNLIWSEAELHKFYDLILPELKSNEVFFISLSARNKYLTKEEKVQLELGRTEMFEKRIIRQKNWDKFLRTIHKFEVNEGGYTTKNNSNIPIYCITCYININPSCVLKAYQEFNRIYNEYIIELANCAVNHHSIDNTMNRITKIEHTLMTCIQKNRGTKHYIDLDFDVPKSIFNAPIEMNDYLKEHDLRFFWIDTHSGYHLLIDRLTLKFNPNNICRKGIEILENKLKEYYNRNELDGFSTDNRINLLLEDNTSINYEIIQNKSEMIPLCGTLQGSHEVKLIDS